jgi:hypothetical protein
MVRSISLDGEAIEVETAQSRHRHLATAEGWDISGDDGTVRLTGLRRAASGPKPLIDLNRPTRVAGTVPHVSSPPALDGTLDGFESDEPLTMDYEDQYRRSEEPYPGPEELSATALVNWDEDALYLGVEVVKPDVAVRPADAPPLRLDNEPEEIHADGVQVYLRPVAGGPVYGFLVTLADEHGGVRVRPAGDGAGTPDMISGAWSRTDAGYTLSLRIALPEWSARGGDTLDFDLLVNEMRPGRVRRAGQLVWSGGGGWVYLRGDRQSPEAFGVLELE